MTPRELSIYVRAHNKNKEEEAEVQRQSIYTSALLISSFVWAKKKRPSYEKVFGIKKKEMTDEEMYKIVKALNRKFGGEEGEDGSS